MMDYDELVAAGRAARAGHTRGWTRGRRYPSEQVLICAICHAKFVRPSRMGPRPRTCSDRCRWTLGKRKARHGPDSLLVNQDETDRRCAQCGSWLDPTGRADAKYCSGRCRVAAHRANAKERNDG